MPSSQTAVRLGARAMSRRFRLSLRLLPLIACLCLHSELVSAAPRDSLSIAAKKELQEIVTGARDGVPVLSGLQVVVIEDAAPVFEFAEGFARLGAESRSPLTVAHKMRVASISKLITAIGAMKLVERGLIDIDADVSEYLGFPLQNPQFPDRPITLRMLLSHTSSIRDSGRYWIEHGKGRFRDLFFDSVSGKPLGTHFATASDEGPGEFFHYANLNFGVVAAVIENTTQRRFDRYMRTEVLGPAGVGADYNVCHLLARSKVRLATLFRKRNSEERWSPDGPWRPQVDGDSISCIYGMEAVPREAAPRRILEAYEPGSNPTVFSPHGGLRASARDLARFVRMFLNEGVSDGARILRPETVREMRRPRWTYDPRLGNGVTYEEETDPKAGTAGLMTSYGLSMHRVDLRDWGLAKCRRILVGHLGNAYGLLGQLWIDFASKTGLVALITGTGDRPRPSDGPAPLYRSEAAILEWWTRHFPAAECRGGPAKP